MIYFSTHVSHRPTVTWMQHFLPGAQNPLAIILFSRHAVNMTLIKKQRCDSVAAERKGFCYGLERKRFPYCREVALGRPVYAESIKEAPFLSSPRLHLILFANVYSSLFSSLVSDFFPDALGFSRGNQMKLPRCGILAPCDPVVQRIIFLSASFLYRFWGAFLPLFLSFIAHYFHFVIDYFFCVCVFFSRGCLVFYCCHVPWGADSSIEGEACLARY